MPPKTVEEQLAELEMEAEAPAPPPKHAKGSRPPRQKINKEDAAALKELEELEALENFQQPAAPRQLSRPNTPKVSSSSTASSNRRAAGVATPSSTASARTSEDNRPVPPRKSGESTRSFHQGFVPPQQEPTRQHAAEPREEKQSGGSWWGGGWGGLVSTATAAAETARKQAEAAYQELQKNQEAQRWAEQVRGNVGALRGLGTCNSTTTFTTHRANMHQAMSWASAPSQPLQTSSTRSPHPSHNMNVSKSTLHMISSATRR